MGAGNRECGAGYCHFFLTILVFKYDIHVTLIVTKKGGRKKKEKVGLTSGLVA